MDQFVKRAIKVLQDIAGHIFAALSAAFDDAAKEAVDVLDGLTKKYLPMAVKHVQDLASADLSSEEKRSVAFTKISQELQSDGQDAMAAGFNAFVNLLIELALNTVRALAGQSLGSSPLAVASLKKDNPTG